VSFIKDQSPRESRSRGSLDRERVSTRARRTEIERPKKLSIADEATSATSIGGQEVLLSSTSASKVPVLLRSQLDFVPLDPGCSDDFGYVLNLLASRETLSRAWYSY